MEKKIFKFILKQYLDSADYNSCSISTLCRKFGNVKEIKVCIINLIKNKYIELYYSETNPFIKNFNQNISIEKQIEMIKKLPDDFESEIIDEIKFDDDIIKLEVAQPISIFPTTQQIKLAINNKTQYYKLPPFKKILLEGMPHLNFLYFRIDVLNRFLYDPRYFVKHLDYTGSIYYNIEHIIDGHDENSIYLSHFGLAYNKKTNENVITIFPHDLAKLSLKHQYHFYSHMLDNQEDYVPDISYYRNVMGDVSEGISIFTAFIEEMQIINTIVYKLCKKYLFKNLYNCDKERPEYFHPFLMPTKTMYCNFCRTLYRMFVDNLDIDTIKSLISKFNLDIPDMEKLKGLTLLEKFFSLSFQSYDGSDTGKEIIQIWKKEIHDKRCRQSHSFVDDKYDLNIFKKYRKTISEAYKSVRLIRLVLSSIQEIKLLIKSNKIEISEDLYNGNINMYFSPLRI
ncbi:hypothetical protein IJG14_04880 [bacterium]|nr:hypothetical protein [bacterium]